MGDCKNTNTWHRPHNLTNPANVISKGGAHFSNINQTGVGSCWLQSEMASLAAMHPTFPYKLIQPSVTAGFWDVTLYRKGNEKVIVTVDEYFPEYKFLGYVQDNRFQFWSELVEKAYAALCYDYPASYARQMNGEEQLEKALDGGLPDEACSVLTGMPSIRFSQDEMLKRQKKSDESTYDFFKRYFEQGYLLTCIADAEGRHGFSIVDMKTDKNGTEYVYIFEPNNVTNYTGKDNIRPALAEQVNDEAYGKRPGLFRCRADELVVICHGIYVGCFDDWRLSTHEFNGDEGRRAPLQVHTQKQTQIRIAMVRTNKRYTVDPNVKGGACYSAWALTFLRNTEHNRSHYLSCPNTEEPLNPQVARAGGYLIQPMAVNLDGTFR